MTAFAAAPLPLSSVTLAGEFAAMQAANREVLLSLNMSRWACHFTTTANLTSCRSAAVPWHTYLKNATVPFGFVHEDGFLGAGDDLAPPSDLLFPDCAARCAGARACVGFCFEAPSEEPAEKVKCYLKTAAHFTPQRRKANCLTNGSATAPPCEPLPGEMGLGGYYGHYQGHWLSATAYLINATGDPAVTAAAAAAVRTLSGVMAAWEAKYREPGYLFPYDPLVWDKLLAGHGAGPYYSVPFYTLHKLMAGLLAQQKLAGSALAGEMVVSMAGWVGRRVERTLAAGGEALWQRVLLTEWGGMNDVLLELYEVTGDVSHLRTARAFNGFVFTAPLAAGRDDLAVLPFPHANFHLPEVVGNARAYELTGNGTDAAIVDAFLGALLANHSYATGGSNSGECWQAPRDLGNFLSTQTEESCTQYNVLKISRHRMLWRAEAAEADYYERALWNGILGNQKRVAGAPTSYIYMLPLGGAVRKAWGKSDYGFPCCWGTLSESFAKLGDSIFFGAPDGSALYVSQFMSASVSWRGVTLTQTAAFPDHPATTSTLRLRVPPGAASRFSLRVRVPGWLVDGSGAVTVNGEPVGARLSASTFLSLDRVWADGDEVVLAYPMRLQAERLNDHHPEHNATFAFLYGPLVLAGVHLTSDIFVPRGGQAYRTDPSAFLRRNATDSLEFEAVAAGGAKAKLIPLYRVVDETYVAYFMTAGTKPPQPKVVYCPHSAGATAQYEPAVDDGDALLVSRGPPSAPAREQHVITSRGVHWRLRDGELRAEPADEAPAPAQARPVAT